MLFRKSGKRGKVKCKKAKLKPRRDPEKKKEKKQATTEQAKRKERKKKSNGTSRAEHVQPSATFNVFYI